jgi:flagellar basal-body rod modification protein FlgD
VTGVAKAGPATAADTLATKPAGSMDQSDFLRLMTTQLTTQDPFNPVDNTQMVAQMAQFSQVAGIAEMNASLKALVDGAGSSRLGDMSGWIGRSVLVESDSAAALPDGSYAGEIALPANADQLTLSLIAPDGSIAHSEDLGSPDAGSVPFSWDGKGPAGEAVPGPLKIVVTARAGGDTVQTATAAWTRVGGIQSPANGAATRLLTPLGAVAPDAAIRLI